jgi:translocation and assembly module TamB
LGAVVLVVVLALAAGLAWLVSTPSGLQFALAQARPWLPEGVRVESAEGRLIGPLRVEGVEVRTAAANLRLDRIDLDWAPDALLTGTVHVNELAVDDVTVTLADTGAPARGDARPTIPALPDELVVPVGIRIDHFTAAPIQLNMPDGTEHRIDRVAFGARVGPDELAVESLLVEAPAGRIEADLATEPAAPWPVSGRIDWDWAPGGDLPALAGHGRFSGTVEDLRIEHELTAPTAVSVNAALQLFGKTPAWRAGVDIPKTRPRDWLASAPALAASADLALEGTLERISAQGRFGLYDVPGGPYDGQLDLDADAETLRIEQVTLRPAGADERRATLRGSLAYAGSEPRFDVTLDWRDLQWPLTDVPTAQSPEGRVALQGTLDDYSLQAGAHVAVPDAGPTEAAELRITGTGTGSGLDGFDARVDWGGARVDLDGGVRWAAPGEARVEAELTDIDPERFGATVAGRIDALLRADARWDQSGIAADVTLERLAGELDGRPMGGSGSARYADGVLTIPELRVDAGESRLRVSGEAGERLAIDWSADMPDLRALTGVASGRISGEGRIEGTPAAPAIVARVEGGDLEWETLRIGALSLRADAVIDEDRDSSAELTLTDIEVGGESMAGVTATLAGRPGRHRLDLTAQGPRGEIDLAATGALDGTDWRGRVEMLRLAPRDRSAWTLAESAPVRWVDGRAAVGDICLLQDPARVCLSGEGTPAGWSARIGATTIPLARLGAFGPEGLGYEGTLDLRADLSGGERPITGEARLDISSGQVSGVIDEETETLLAWEAGRIDATLGEDRVDGRMTLPLADGGRLAATVGIARGDTASLSGRVQGRVDELALIAGVVPAIGRVDGRLIADIGLGGTLGDPRLEGNAELEEGRVTIIPLGTEITELELDLETIGRGFRVHFGGRSGEGQLQSVIDLRRGDGGAWYGEGRITGEDFTAVSVPELALDLSPDVRWRVEGREIRVDGSVAVPFARIAPRDISGAVQTSPDAVIVGDEGEPQTVAGWQIFADVGVDLGEDVRVDAFGLEGRLGGNINIRERPDRLTTANGELRVEEGTYTIYRQSLEIERGRVLFDGGPVADPGLDVRAVRRPRDVIVGVDVRGTLRQPRATLFSEPPLPESQQLSYLIAGVPLGESSGSERGAMAAAAAAIATSEQGQAIAGQFGIQEVSVDRGEPGTADGASLVLGRYLSPRLYVGYGIGLAEQANSVRMRYELTRRWSVEARSGAAASADLLYSIETDGGVEP